MRALIFASLLLSVAPHAQPWTVGLRGIGPVQYGVSVEDAQSAGIELYSVESGSDDPFTCGYVELSGQPGIAFMTTEGRLIRADVSAPFVRTRSGIGIGSSEGDVLEAYGDRITTEPHPYDEDGRYLIYTPRDLEDATYRIVFETSWGYVTSYRSGLLPAVRWIEGCL